MAQLNRRRLLGAVAATPAAAIAVGCTDDADGLHRRPKTYDLVSNSDLRKSPYEFGAVGNGTNDDTDALRATYDAVVAGGGGTIDVSNGSFYIPGNFEMNEPGINLVGDGGTVIGGGEVVVGPVEYDRRSSGVDYSGTRVSGLIFDRGDDYGAARCLVLRNVRGLDICHNVFRGAGKGVAVESADGNIKVHTTAMLNVSNNRFGKLQFGIFGDTEDWDTLSDWTVNDNYFNFCSDTAIWIASTHRDRQGGIDGLGLSGNTVFSMNHNTRDEPLFAMKRYNVKLGQTNWLRIVNNSFFESGLSAVYLDSPKHFTIVGNHVAWPGQRELGDAVEIHGGNPTGAIEGNTFALWTRAAVGLYDVADASRILIGQNAMNWDRSPNSWTRDQALPGYRIYVSAGTSGYPAIRDFQNTGAFDVLGGSNRQQSRDMKTPNGGITGAVSRSLAVTGPTAVFQLSDITGLPHYGGMLSVTVTSSSDDSQAATYLLFVSAPGSVCNVIASGGYVEGLDSSHPSFSWMLSDDSLQVVPIGAAAGTYDFAAVSIGAVALS